MFIGRPWPGVAALYVRFVDTLFPFILAVAFAAAYLHVRVLSRRRPGGGLARLILAGGACVLLLYALYEFSVQRKFKPENVPIRVDMLFIGPALVGLLILGVIAYVYGLGSPKVASAPSTTPSSQQKTAVEPGQALTPEEADERLTHLLPKQKNGQEN